MFRTALVALTVLSAAPALAQQGMASECTPAGVWYGGSVTAYQLTVTPSVPAGHYTVSYFGMYKLGVLNSPFNGTLVKKGNAYEGSAMGLSTFNPDFVEKQPGEAGEMPDVLAGWMTMRMVDCNTMESVISFFGTYLGVNMWAPGLLGATFTDKVPLVDPPDVDMLQQITGGYPIIERYRRVPTSVNPDLLHKLPQ